MRRICMQHADEMTSLASAVVGAGDAEASFDCLHWARTVAAWQIQSNEGRKKFCLPAMPRRGNN